MFGTDASHVENHHVTREGIREMLCLPPGDAGSTGNATFQHLCIDDLYSDPAIPISIRWVKDVQGGVNGIRWVSRKMMEMEFANKKFDPATHGRV